MHWDINNSPVSASQPEGPTVASRPEAEPSPTKAKSPTFARLASVVVLIVAIGAGGFALGHYVDTPNSLRVASPGFSIPSFPSGGSNGQLGSPEFTITPPTYSGQPTPAQTKTNAAADKIATKVGAGLVDITSTFTTSGATAMGTGMILTANGLVLTNNHVIEDATSIVARDVKTNTTYKATVVGYDLSQDVALLQLSDASGLSKIKTGDSNKLSAGEKIVGIGNAGGLGGTPSYAAGTVKALNQSITAGDESNPAGMERLSGLVEVDADIQPGDSGGPLVNTKGWVVGMDTAGSDANGGFGFLPYGSSTTSAGFAIPIDTALAIVKSIENGDSSSSVHVGATPFLGVEFDAASALQGQGGPSATAGVAIAGVVAGQPAAGAGLVTGDVITSINGVSVTSGTGLQSVLLTLQPGDSLKIGYVNTNGTAVTASATLASGPPQ